MFIIHETKYTAIVYPLTKRILKVASIQLKDLAGSFKISMMVFYLKNRRAVHDALSLGIHPGRDLYQYYNFRFRWLAPFWLKKHRKYFSRKQRGFGEKPFHSMWQDIFAYFKPINVLEIGVYRGQIISLWQLIAKKNDLDIEVHGISPLQNIGDSVSNYLQMDYENDINQNFDKFHLNTPKILRALSTDSTARKLFESKKWDLIYIDGSHDFEVALQDYRLAIANLKNNGVICIDDSSLLLDLEIYGIFKGHPGPSRVLMEFAKNEMKHFMTVGHNNFLVKVEKSVVTG